MTKHSKALIAELTAGSAKLDVSPHLSPDSHGSMLQGDAPEKNLRKSVFTDKFKEDLQDWKKTSPKTVKRIRKLIEAIINDPFQGIGKPEPLKYQGSDVWSRRINDEHRIIYLISADQIAFLQARKHY